MPLLSIQVAAAAATEQCCHVAADLDSVTVHRYASAKHGWALGRRASPWQIPVAWMDDDPARVLRFHVVHDFRREGKPRYQVRRVRPYTLYGSTFHEMLYW